MNKFLVIKDVLAICGDTFSESTKNHLMGCLMDRAKDILDDLYPIPSDGAKSERNNNHRVPLH